MKRRSARQYWMIWIVTGMLIGLGVSPAASTQTEIWTVGTFEDFQRGEAEGLSLSESGELSLAPQIQELFRLEGNDVLAWSMAADSKGNLYIGTGDQGRIFKMTPAGETSIFFDSPEISILSLVIDAADNVYAGTAPDGLIYKITPEGSQTTFFMTEDHYVWSLVFGSDHTLYAGTGEAGKVYKILPDGTGAVLYDSPQTHIMTLLYDPQGWLYAGTEGRGIVYKVDLNGKAFALYQTKEQEIHTLARDSQGNLYFAALSNKVYPQPPVQAADDQQINSPQEKSSKFSVIYRMSPQGTISKVLELSEMLIYAMVIEQQDYLLIGTDNKGKVYRVFPDGTYQQVAAVNTGNILTLKQQPDGMVYLGTGDAGAIYQIALQSFVDQGQYVSIVHDAGLTATWGKIFWRGSMQGIALYTRTGNTAAPDDTWSPWSPALQNKEGEAIPNPLARFIQWKAVMQNQEQETPVLEEVSLAYLPHNLAPKVTDVMIYYAGEQEQDEQNESSRRPTNSNSSAPTSSANARSKQNGIKPPKFVPSGYVAIAWNAEDPNKESLLYTISLRGAEDAVWKVLEEEVTSTVYLLDITTLPDGEYDIKITASDLPDNPPPRALTAEKISERFTIDNTAPQVSIALSQKQDGETLQVIVVAQDDFSRLQHAQYAVDAGEWLSIFPDDHVTDSRDEKYTITLPDLESGKHILTFKATDQFGNIGVGKIQFSTDGLTPQP